MLRALPRSGSAPPPRPGCRAAHRQFASDTHTARTPRPRLKSSRLQTLPATRDWTRTIRSSSSWRRPVWSAWRLWGVLEAGGGADRFPNPAGNAGSGLRTRRGRVRRQRLHREANATLLVRFDHLDLDLLAFLQIVG